MRHIVFYLYSLRGLVALASKFQLLLTTRFIDNPMVSAVLGVLDQSVEVATKAIGSATKQPLTKTVRQADKVRDDQYKALKSLIINGTRRNNAAYREACLDLAYIIEKNNPMLYVLGDKEETAAITSLLHDLDEEPAKTRIAAINAEEWVAELVQANQDFVAASEGRSGVIAADDTLTDRKAFKNLEKSMKLVCNMLDSHLGYGQPADIQDIVNIANQYIREANASARLSGPRDDDEE